MEKGNVLLLLSGGIDSAACLHFYKHEGYSLNCLFVDYGQLSIGQEEKAAREISRFYGLEPAIARVKSNMILNQKGEIVGRNAFLLTLALTQFRSKSGIIATGIHAGTGYDDCRTDFKDSMQTIFDMYKSNAVMIGAPFIRWTKNEIWDYCKANGVPLHLTYSCELGLEQPCGQCATCKDLKILYAN